MTNIYFAHTSHMYGTSLEKQIIDYLERDYDAVVINPKEVLPQGDKEQAIRESVKYMLNNKVDMLVYVEFGGHIGEGIQREIHAALAIGIPVFLFDALS